jgi:hypothetical protein
MAVMLENQAAQLLCEINIFGFIFSVGIFLG